MQYFSLINFLSKELGLNKSDIRKPPKSEMGDLSLRIKGSPEDVKYKAGQIEENLRNIASVEIIGNYINLRFQEDFLLEMILNVGRYPDQAVREDMPKKYLIEYSAPNTNKPLHLGHARNSVLGMSLANLYAFIGDNVNKVNLVNDRGIHICKSMMAYMLFGEGRTPESEGIKGDHFVGEYYVMFEKECLRQAQAILDEKELKKENFKEDDWKEKTDEAKEKTLIMQNARDLLRKWEDGDPETITLWENMNSWVIDGINGTYKRFGSEFDKYYYESETYRLGKDMVEKGLEKGILKKREDHAIYCDLEKFGFGKKVLLRADGTSVYMTQDLGTTKLKYEDSKADKLIWVVASEQKYHFQVLFKVLELLGYEFAKNCFHYSYEMVDLPTGRMKSREGTVIDLDDLLDALKERVLEIIKERKMEITVNVDKTADNIGKAALKYFILSHRPGSKIVFDIDNSLAFEGKTGPYILYQYVRAGKILEKAGFINLNEELKIQKVDLFEQEEKKHIHNLLLSLLQFSDVIKESADLMDQTKIADLIYDLARSFSSFYNDVNVLKEENSEKKEILLSVVFVFKKLLGICLDILGIEKVEEM